MPRRASAVGRIVPLVFVLGVAASAAASIFESDVVRPLALSPDGARLFAVDTPDARLEIFRATEAGLAPEASVPVGLEPVAVAVRSATEVWVVNHLSDSVSVVDVGSDPPRVVRTLWVGDEPRDVVFAGPGRSRAFVTTAHRGQSSPVDAALFEGGVGRADVWVFDADALGAGGGTPIAVLSLFGDTPRALAATADGATVYAAVYRSGNQTTTIGFGSVCEGGEAATCDVDGTPMPGGLPEPNVNVFGDVQPRVGLIARYEPGTGAWRDEIGRDWRDAVRFELPDLDVFAIDAMATPPAPGATWAHVGTILFDLAVNPVSGRVYVSNTEARNERRFAGLGSFAGRSVRGRLHESRITVLAPGTTTPRHLNKHIDYDVVPSPPGVKERSLAQPMGMAVSADGSTLYVAAMGSDAVGVFETAALEADTFAPDASTQIPVTGGGPTGLALDDARGRLYVSTRFDMGVSVVALATRSEIAHVRMHDPEPAAVVAGRPLFYDARRTSSNGEASCAVCHVFGDTDALAWDLGDPDEPTRANPNPTRELEDTLVGFRALKGPMTTQTFRGIATQGPMHWRGDRSGALDPGGDAFDERAALRQFNEAFVGLLGLAAPLAPADLERLVDFGLAITVPPNPLRALDASRSGEEAEGETEFTTGDDPCVQCHRIDPAIGAFGADGFSAPTDGGIQFFLKVPPLHSLYQKVGLFEMRPPFNNGDTTPVGPQIRGFGFMHEGAQGFPASASQRKLEFAFRFPGPLAPVVGQQATLGAGDPARAARADLLVARAAAGECDLVVHGLVDGELRGWLRGPDGLLVADRAAEAPVGEDVVRATAAPGAERSYTCAPPGRGVGMAIDRDADGFLDGDERVAGTDPAAGDSRPLACDGGASLDRLRATLVPGRRKGGVSRFTLRGVLPAAVVGDPTTGGLALTLRDDAGRVLAARVTSAGAWSARKRRWQAGPDGWLDAVVVKRGRTATLRVDASDPPLGLSTSGSLRVEVGVDGTACASAAVGCRARGRRGKVVCGPGGAE